MAGFRTPLQSTMREFDSTIRFYLNGRQVETKKADTVLIEYLRSIGLTGTKLGCGEGGCGSCTVIISESGKDKFARIVNACLAPMIAIHGKHVTTIEGLGNTEKPHSSQQHVAAGNGSQCGFCTPGFVMSLYGSSASRITVPSPADIEDAFSGNLCRCTGYRSILDAAHKFHSTHKILSKSSRNSCGALEENSHPRSSSALDHGDKGPAIYAEIERPCTTSEDCREKCCASLPLMLNNEKTTWIRPVTLPQLLEIKRAYPTARVVNGNTETQVEIKYRDAMYPVSIYIADIAELKGIQMGSKFLVVGGGTTLSELEQFAAQPPNTGMSELFQALHKQLGVFASRQVRNVGTLAGNILNASPLSDLIPLLFAAGARIDCRSSDRSWDIAIDELIVGYRKTSLPSNAVLISVRIPIPSRRDYFRAYKQSRRREDDTAIVTAAFRIQIDECGIIKEICLVYGGVAPTALKAKRTAHILTNKCIWHSETLEMALLELEKDVVLTIDVPGGMASYKRALAMSFFHRFYHDILRDVFPDESTARFATECSTEIIREISRGSRDIDRGGNVSKRIIGTSLPHVASLKQCTGQAQYVDDIPPAVNELYGSLVKSERAHAKFSIDTSVAMQVLGVVDFISHHDLHDSAANYWGPVVHDEPFFAVDEVVAVGQVIGMVVATSLRQAEAGARAVKVMYEDRPFILSIEDAIKAKSFFAGYDHCINDGDAPGAMQNADLVFEGVAKMAGQEHFYLEPQGCIALPTHEGDGIEIFSSTQNPTETQKFVAQVTGMPRNRVVCRVKRIGGGFGGKETRSIPLACICATAAHKLQRPVRGILNRHDDMLVSGQRHPSLVQWKVALDTQHRFVAMEAVIYCNAGWSQDLSFAVMDRALAHIDGCYRFPNLHVRGHVCRTNTASNTAFRGFGGPQASFAVESLISEIADHLGIKAEELRRVNMYKPGDRTHFRQTLEDWHIPLMWEQMDVQSLHHERRGFVDAFNKQSKWSKKGLAMIPTKFGIGFTVQHLHQAGALVHIYQDGSVLLSHGGVEMGQGLHTKMIMIAAESLGVTPESIHVSETATNNVSNTSATAASLSSDLNGYAVLDACTVLARRLKPYRERLGHVSFKELVQAAYHDRVNLSANGFYESDTVNYHWGDNNGNMVFYFTQGVALAEVEIDLLTGDWTCTRADIKMDVGKSINPAVDYGQIEGAFIQGMGLFTTEESLWDRAGRLRSLGPGAYKIPTSRDIPQQLNVSLLQDAEWTNLRTIERSRGVGEPPLFLGSSVFFAIRDALVAARSQWGCEDILTLASPATVERIRTSCTDSIMQRAWVKAETDKEPVLEGI